MGYWLTSFHLKFFNFRLRVINAFSSFFDRMKEYSNWKRHPHLKKVIFKISSFFHKLADNLVKNKENWKERIIVGGGFFIPEDE